VIKTEYVTLTPTGEPMEVFRTLAEAKRAAARLQLRIIVRTTTSELLPA
jgi:hypothetical protein